MRIGECPNRVKRDHVAFARVTACVLVCIPHQLDYYSHRLEILQLCLASLRAHAARDSYELLVFDNGSCAEAVEYLRVLHARGDIDHLILSARNVGKINALRMMFAAAPGDVVAYADDDVWFGQGWLTAQLEILDAFPRVGMVSGRPVRRQFAYGNVHLPEYLTQFPGITAHYGHFIPEEWEREYLRSTGQDEREAAAIAAANTDVLLDCHGVRAYATSTHFQFLAPKAVILAALDKHDQPRTGSEERQFEEAIEAMGFARLSTVDRYVRHIGNVISDELRDEARRANPELEPVVSRRPAPLLLRLARLRPLRYLLSRLNRWSYFLLHQ